MRNIKPDLPNYFLYPPQPANINYFYDVGLFSKSCLATVVVIEAISAIYYNVNTQELLNRVEYMIINANEQLLFIIIMLLVITCFQVVIVLYCSMFEIKLYIYMKQSEFLLFFCDNKSLALFILESPIRIICLWFSLKDNLFLYVYLSNFLDSYVLCGDFSHESNNGYVFANPSTGPGGGMGSGGSPNFTIPTLPPKHPFQYIEGWYSRRPGEIHNDNDGRQGVSLRHFDSVMCDCYKEVHSLEQLRGGWHECILDKWIIFMEYDYDTRISYLREMRVDQRNPSEIGENIAAALRHIQRYDGITLIYYSNINNLGIWTELARAQTTEMTNDMNSRGEYMSPDAASANFQRFFEKKFVHANSKILRILEKQGKL